MKHSAEFVVIGAGVAGLLTALEVLRRGRSVIVVDAGFPPASYAGAGIISALPPWSCPPPVASLIAESRRRLGAITHEIEADTGYDCEWRRPGMLVMPDQSPPTLPEGATMTPAGWLAPLVAARKSWGMWMPEIGSLKSAQFTAGLRALVKKQGAEFILGKAQIETDDSKNTVTHVQTADAQLHGEHYIICAGARSGQIGPPPVLPVFPVRGQLLLYKTVKPLLCIVLDCSEDIYLSPREDDTIIVGASFDEDAGFDNRPLAAMQAVLHQKACKVFPPFKDASILDSWSGLRPCLPDEIPCIGPHPACSNLFFNAGHGRYGIATASAAARHLLKMIAEPETQNPFAFRPEWQK